MSFTPEQLSLVKKSYADPVFFVDTFINRLTPLEKELLGSLEHGSHNRTIQLNRDVANKMTFQYVIWRAIFKLDCTHVIVADSMFHRTVLWVDLLNILESLPDWIIEHLEIDTDGVEYNRVRVNGSGDIILLPAESRYLRGRTITTLVVQDLNKFYNKNEVAEFRSYSAIFSGLSSNFRHLYTNATSLSIS